jgi:hypothetical protein
MGVVNAGSDDGEGMPEEPRQPLADGYFVELG